MGIGAARRVELHATAARAQVQRGRGTCRWTPLGTASADPHGLECEAARHPGLPSNIRQGVLIPTAYYTGETFRPAPRRPVQEVMHLNHW